MRMNRQSSQISAPDRGLGIGVPHPVARISREQMAAVERQEDESVVLPDLYMRKFRILEKMLKDRPQFPFAANPKNGTNKPVFFQHTQWDKVLKEVYWRAADFQEEKKSKIAQAFHLSKKMKNTMGKKFRIRDELNFYHKLLCFQFSKDLEDFFGKVKEQVNDHSSIITREYIPPHELKEIKKREAEEKERKEKEEAQKKRDLEIERQQNQFVDLFFNDDNFEHEENNHLLNGVQTQNSVLSQEGQHHQLSVKEEEIHIDGNNQLPNGNKKQLKPIAGFVFKMMELNQDCFDTMEMKVMSEYRDFHRKKDVIDKLRDIIIKYGGKRKERQVIDTIFLQVQPQNQQQQQLQQQLAPLSDKLDNSVVIFNEQQQLRAQNQMSNYISNPEEKQEDMDDQENDGAYYNDQDHSIKQEDNIDMFVKELNFKEEGIDIINENQAASNAFGIEDDIDVVIEVDRQINEGDTSENSDRKLPPDAPQSPIAEPIVEKVEEQQQQSEQEMEQMPQNDEQQPNVEAEIKIQEQEEVQVIQTQKESNVGEQQEVEIVTVQEKIEEEQEEEEAKEVEKDNSESIKKENIEIKQEQIDVEEISQQVDDQIHLKKESSQSQNNEINNYYSNREEEGIEEIEIQSMKVEVSNEELEKQKNQLRQALAQMCAQLDQSACSIMSVENKKKKRRDESQKETLNEDFLSHIKILNPHFDPKKVKHENLSELLMFTYNKNSLPSEFDKMFEKTINNYTSFPRDYSQIPRVQEVPEDEIEVKGQESFDLPYETFCYTHSANIDKFLKKAYNNLSLIANSNQIQGNNPGKDNLNREEMFQIANLINKQEHNFFAIYICKDQQVITRVLTESSIVASDKYRSLSLISKQPIFFYFLEYYQGIWGSRLNLINCSLNSNPITKNYDFTHKLIEKLDWIKKMKKKQKFTFVDENILPTMYQFRRNSTEMNKEIKQFEEEKEKKDYFNQNDLSTFIDSEEDFEKQVEKREKISRSSQNFGGFRSGVQRVYKNMNKSMAKYFEENKVHDPSQKFEYRKGILEYAKTIKKTQFPIETREEPNGKTIDYSSFTKMVKAEDVKSLIIKSRQNSSSLLMQPKPLSRKKIITDQQQELISVMNYFKNNIPQPNVGGMGQQQQQGNMGDMSFGNGRQVPIQMRHMMNNRQMPPGQFSHQYPPNPNIQGQPPQRSHQGQYDQQGHAINGIPMMPPGHMHSSSNMPVPPNMMMQMSRGPPPQHGMPPSQGTHERVPPSSVPPQLHHSSSQGQPPPYGGQQQANGQIPHHHHLHLQGSSQSQQGGNPSQQGLLPIHNQMGGQSAMHHISPGQGLPPNVQQSQYQGSSHGYQGGPPQMVPGGVSQKQQILQHQQNYQNPNAHPNMNSQNPGGIAPNQGGQQAPPPQPSQEPAAGQKKITKNEESSPPQKKGQKKQEPEKPKKTKKKQDKDDGSNA